MGRTLLLLLISFGLPLMAWPALAQSLLRNGEFSEWNGDDPAHWEISVGARRGDGEESWINRGGEGGIQVEGYVKTKIWRLLSQSFEVQTGKSYGLTYTARASGLARDAGQFQSCYVGLAFFDGGGERLLMQVRDVREGPWQSDPLYVAAPEGAVRGAAMIFLAHTGRLEVREVKVAEAKSDPAGCFDILVADMGRHYSYFDHKRINWDRLSGAYRKKMKDVRDVDGFVKTIKPLLAKLKDLHVTIEKPDGTRVPTYMKNAPRNHDYDTLIRRLRFPRKIGTDAIVGKTRDGFGYVAIFSLLGDDAYFDEVVLRIEPLLTQCAGILVDIRANIGGNEMQARKIASIFADEERVYARSQVRSGPARSDLTDGSPRILKPREGLIYKRPVVCLIGPGCVSSGEGFAMMMKSIPNVTMVGMPTRGASGNPAPVALPNGVRVHYSRWVAQLPDGTVIEGKGVKPDIPIPHKGSGDPTFEKAREFLIKRCEEYEKK